MSELQSLILTRRGWMSWMFLHLMASGARCLVSVHQPPVVSAVLGHNVILPCELQSSHDDKMVKPPVLYWERSSPADSPKLWPPSQDYLGRVYRLENNSHSQNKSILFKHVQWTDGGKYVCKLTITLDKVAKSFRKIGNGTMLVVHDNITFNLSSHNDSRLQCEVNVSRGPGCVLSILHNGSRLPTVAAARRLVDADSPHVTFSESVSLRGAGKYECQLHVNEELVTHSVFRRRLPGECGGDMATTRRPPAPGLLVVPEPWFLYMSLLLVPITFLLGILTARVLCKS